MDSRRGSPWRLRPPGDPYGPSGGPSGGATGRGGGQAALLVP